MEKAWLDSGAYVVRICPACRCQQTGYLAVAHQTHTGDCPNRNRTFAIEELKAVPLSAVPSRPGGDAERVLDELVEVTERFVTDADYTVTTGIEEELVAALDDAKRILRSASVAGPGKEGAR